MKRAILLVLVLAMLLASLSGCFFSSGEELYSLPQLPDEYVELQKIIDEVLAGGAEYAAPVSGSNRQSVQLRDLDGDGVEEALAFFRSGEEKPLKIYIFRRMGERYEVAATIAGVGASVDSINYTDLNLDGVLEVIVGFKISDGVAKAMSVYSVKDWELKELAQCSYSEYTFCDFNSDSLAELMVIRYDDVETTGVAELYDFSGEEAGVSSASMSSGITSVSRIKSARLEDGTPAVFVASLYADSGVVTDIFTARSGKLRNITLDEWSGVSGETVRSYVTYATDIDSDGVMELPQPVQLPVHDAADDADKQWITNWYSYYSDGSPVLKRTTYHNYTDGWYLDLPEGWDDAITVSRTENSYGEHIVTFMLWRGEYLDPVPLLRIYALSGDNKNERAQLGDRQLLQVSSNYYYAYELLAAYQDWSLAIEASELGARFSLIKSEWNTGET